MSKKELHEFNCPFCHVKIPLDYMAKKTKLVPAGPKQMLVCIGCANEYTEVYEKVTEIALADDLGNELGISAAAAAALRKEKEYYRNLDDERVDEEVDVKDVKKAKKLFYDRNDPLAKPIDVMKNSFLKGMQKEREKSGLFPVKSKIIKPGDKGFKI